MKQFQFTAKPRWGRKSRVASTVITASDIKEARKIARLEWAMQGRLPNNTQIVEL